MSARQRSRHVWTPGRQRDMSWRERRRTSRSFCRRREHLHQSRTRRRFYQFCLGHPTGASQRRDSDPQALANGRSTIPSGRQRNIHAGRRKLSYPVERGGTVFIPKNAWHGFATPEHELLLLWIMAPAGLDSFFRETAIDPACRQNS